MNGSGLMRYVACGECRYSFDAAVLLGDDAEHVLIKSWTRIKMQRDVGHEILPIYFSSEYSLVLRLLLRLSFNLIVLIKCLRVYKCIAVCATPNVVQTTFVVAP